MKKLLAFILSIGMCFACVGFFGCEKQELSDTYEPQNVQSSTKNDLPKKQIEDISELSNDESKELASKLKKENVYPVQTLQEVASEYLIVELQYSVLLEDLEEVEKKQIVLDNTKNSCTVRVFNAETGQWEMQPDARAIKSAEIALNNAVEAVYLQYQIYGGAILNLNIALEAFIYDCVAEMIESYIATNISIREKLEAALVLYTPLPEKYIGFNQYSQYTASSPYWFTNIIKIIKDFCGIEL